GYILDETSNEALDQAILELYHNRNLNLRNGLMIKQYLDILIREQSIRICDTKINNKEMSIIIPQDIIKSKNEFLFKNILE
ncbi:hypothetical protein, partial [Clostridium perfringens]